MHGKIIYFTIAAILGIVASYTMFQWLTMIFCVLYFFYLYHRKLAKSIFFGCIITFILFAAYFFIVDLVNVSHYANPEIKVVGKISSLPKINGDKFVATIKTNQNEKLLLTYKIPTLDAKEELSNITVGMVCNLKGMLEEPPSARNPNGFNYKQYLYFQNIHWLFTPNKLTPKFCEQTSSSLLEYIRKIRQKGIVYIENNFPPVTASFVEALIYGDRSNISEKVIKSYQSLGTIHILAISGLHVSFLTGIIFYIGIRMGVTRERMYLFLFLFIPIYIFLAGAAPSVIRAGIMTMIGILSLKFPHYLNSLDAIAISCLLMLLIQPYYLFQIGFQLSFVVSCALILSARMILTSSQSYFKQICFVTFIAQIIVFPLILYYFYEISLLSFVANLIFIPLFSVVVLPLAIFSYLVHMVVEPIGEIAIRILSFTINLSNFLSLHLSTYKVMRFNFGKPAQILMIAYYFIIVYFIISWEKRKNILFSAFCFVIILLIHWNWYSFVPTGTITMIDVGQGDSFLIELPYRKAVYLIDTGGTTTLFEKEKWRVKKNEFSVGEDVLLPFLKGKGIRKIDKLILTHGDTDHMGASSEIIPNITINKVFFPKGPSFDEVEKKLFNQLAKANIPLQFVNKGKKWSISGISFYILSPVGDEQIQNNRSIVILTKIGGKRWLFTGDLEEEGEKALLSTYPNLKVDILKVGHHGSKSSSSESFVKNLSPSIALISVGIHNRFHHPHPDTLQRLDQHHIKMLRTDLNGAVEYKFTKENGTFHTQFP